MSSHHHGLSFLTAACFAAPTAAAQQDAPDLQESFDTIGPDVQEMTLSSGKSIGYVDEGAEDADPVLFVGGAGTSAYAFALTGHLRRMRTDLGLRFVVVERDGFGITDLTEDYTYADYADEADHVLDELGVEEDVAVVAISGGGPYAAAFAAEYPDRVRSLHLLAAFSEYDPDTPETMSICQTSPAERRERLARYATHPRVWWNLGEHTPTDRIPGFQTAAENDGARTFTMRGQAGDPAALVAEYDRYCSLPAPDGSELEAPVYIYEGAADTTVSPLHGDFWEANYPNVAERTAYEGVGHTVQYRHWDQVMLDIAGMTDKDVMCVDGTSTLVPESETAGRRESGATLGICAWQ